MNKKFLNRCIAQTYIVSLSDLLEKKMLLLKEFNMTEEQIDNMPYWLFEESIRVAEYKKTTTK